MAFNISKLTQAQASVATTERGLGYCGDKDGNIYASFSGQGIWKIDTRGNISKILSASYGLANTPDSLGYMYYRDTSNNIMKFHPTNPKNAILVEAAVGDMNTIAVNPKRRETIYYSKYTSGQIYEKSDKGGSSNVATGSGYTMHDMYSDGTYLYIPLYSTTVQVWTQSGWGNTTWGLSGNPTGVAPYKGRSVIVARDDDGVVTRGTNSASLGTIVTMPARGASIGYSPKTGTIYFGGSLTGIQYQNYVVDYQKPPRVTPTMLRAFGGIPSNAYLQSAVESITVSDTKTTLRGYYKAIAEAVTISEVNIRALTKAIVESITTADVVAGTKVIVANIVESVTINEALASARAAFKSVVESITAADARIGAITRSITDSVTVADVVAGIKVTIANVVESITASDTYSYTRGYYTSIVEAITIGEAKIAALGKVIVESITISEVVASTKAYLRSVADSITVADAITRQSARGVQIIETIVIHELPAAAKNGFAISLRFFKKYAEKVVTFTKKYTENP